MRSFGFEHACDWSFSSLLRLEFIMVPFNFFPVQFGQIHSNPVKFSPISWAGLAGIIGRVICDGHGKGGVCRGDLSRHSQAKAEGFCERG
jgi:hypothetical protein